MLTFSSETENVMKFEPSYFEDEIREGFYIPGMVKRSWAAQLTVLKEIDKIAKKHNLNWFADFGTLIGAVRHEGFIPWDDDLDISMLREDYEKFKVYVKDELPEGYEYLCFDNVPDYDNFVLRITNNHSINMSNDYLRDNCGFPYTAGVDIFAIDYVYADESLEIKRREKAHMIWTLIVELKSGNCSLTREAIAKQVQEATGYKMNPSLESLPALHKVLERIYSECSKEQAGAVTSMPQYMTHPTRVFPIDYYTHSIEMPFENATINVPVMYGDILTIVYGDWERSVRAGGIHDYPFFVEQEAIVESKGLKNPYKYDFLLPGPDEDEKRRKHEERNDDGLAIIHTLQNVVSVIMSSIASGDLQSALKLLENSQQLSIQLGNNLEQTYEGCDATVSLLENNCELIFNLYNAIVDGETVDLLQQKKDFEDLLSQVEISYKALNKSLKDVIFVLARASEWPFVEKIYWEYANNKAYNTYVMAVPFAYRDNCGGVGQLECQAEMFPKNINLIPYDGYEFALRHVDKIFFTNPFDEYKSAMTVHSFFYASNLRHICNELIYVQPFELEGLDDEKTRANAKRYVLTPGLSMADRVILPSEDTKNLYASILFENCEISKETWLDKMQVCAIQKDELKSKNDILFYISISDILKGKDKALAWIKETIEKYRNYGEGKKVYWYCESITLEELHNLDKNLAKELEIILSRFSKIENFEIVDKNRRETILDDIGEFCGSGGYLYNQCVLRKVPAILMKHQVQL